MPQAYFGEFAGGRLKRLPFLVYALLIGVLMFAFMFGTVALIVGAEKAIGGDLAAAQDLIRNALALPYIIIFAIFMIALILAGANITAKRARDCGLPGWLFVLAFAALTMAASWAISQKTGQSVSTIVFVGLLFIPTNMFQRDSR